MSKTLRYVLLQISKAKTAKKGFIVLKNSNRNNIVLKAIVYEGFLRCVSIKKQGNFVVVFFKYNYFQKNIGFLSSGFSSKRRNFSSFSKVCFLDVVFSKKQKGSFFEKFVTFR